MPIVKILFIGLILELASCKIQPVNKTVTSDHLTEAIEKKLEPGAKRVNNYDNTYVLSWREDSSSGTLVIRYGVWEIKTAKLIYAGTALRGSVKWLDNTSLLVEDYPGTVNDGSQKYKFRIDLTTKIKTPLNEKKDL
jgi:hypothetical protein